jgi:hypothetical protein
LDEPIKGAKELAAKLLALAGKLPQAEGAALYQEALVESKESQRRTPVEFGVLRASHEVQPPVFSGLDVSVEIQVGGDAKEYALIVHENLEVDHPVGQAKFLESTLFESAPFMAERVAKRMNLLGLL